MGFLEPGLLCLSHLLTLSIICYEVQPPADDELVKRVTSISSCF
jgi:hypothetical protein